MRSPRGFSLVELLVVIAIIGILVAMLLPAVQAAREAARRMHCLNNLKQVGLALQQYHSAHKVLPIGMVSSNNCWEEDGSLGASARLGWFPSLLPYIEQQTMYDRWRKEFKAGTWSVGFSLRDTIVPSFICPSDPIDVVPAFGEGFAANYLLCGGAKAWGNKCTKLDSASKTPTGMFYPGSAVKFKSVQDGLSHTLMAAETLRPDQAKGTIPAGCNAHDHRGVIWEHLHMTTLVVTLRPPNSTAPDIIGWGCWHTPEVPCICGYDGDIMSSRSAHSGGAMQLLGDGSVHLVDESIDAGIYQALGTIAGGESIAPF